MYAEPEQPPQNDRQHVAQKDSGYVAPIDIVFLTPNDTPRRFPALIHAERKMIAIAAVLLMVVLAIAYLFWRQQEEEGLRISGNSVRVAQPLSTIPLDRASREPSPVPVIDDRLISEAVKVALTAYNPSGFRQYKFETKDGVVTVGGEAEHLPEKAAVDTVIRLVPGVKAVINNLRVKPESPSTPIEVNPDEARVLDEALLRLVEADKSDRQRQAEFDRERDAERQLRESAVARQREDEIALRKAAEEKLRRDGEEFEKRQEELRLAEAERRERAEQARFEASVLRSGTIAWSGIVDGIDDVLFSGASSSVRHISGTPPREVRASFSAPIPRSTIKVALLSADGRSPIQIQEQPSIANGYTAIVRIDDSNKGGNKRYQFTLRWTLQ